MATIGNAYSSPSGGSKVTADNIQLTGVTTSGILTNDSSGTVTSSGPEIIFAKRDSKQTSGIVSGSKIVFTVTETSLGAAISLDEGTGIFTLVGGNTYKLSSSLGRVDLSSGGHIAIRWYDITKPEYIGKGGGKFAHPGSEINMTDAAVAVFTPESNTEVEVRIASTIGVQEIGNFDDFRGQSPHACIEIVR